MPALIVEKPLIFKISEDVFPAWQGYLGLICQPLKAIVLLRSAH